jgi:AraC-like DNA-binding protein
MRGELNQFPLELIRGQLLTLQHAGIDPCALADIDIPEPAFAKQRLDDTHRISIVTAGLVARRATQLINDRDNNSNLGVAHTHLLFMSALHSKTLGELLQTQYDQANSLNSSLGLSTESGGQTYLCGFSHSGYPPDTPPDLLQRCEIAQLFWWYRVICWFVGELVPLQSITISGADTGIEAIGATLFQCPVHFNAECYGIQFATGHLDLPVSRDREDLQQLIKDLGKACTDIRTPLARTTSALVQAMLMREPDLQMTTVAQRLHCSRHTVIRRLRENNTSFRALKTSARMRKAGDLLREQGNSIENISSQLGFANPPAFTRAFKAYYALSPSQFREQHRLSSGFD